MEKGGAGRLLFLFLGPAAVWAAVWAAVLIAAVIAVAPARAEGQAEGRLELSPLVIETLSGAHRFRVELAASPRARARGLMHRPSLAPERGMLFDYGAPVRIAMWMKNTLIPLDMIFIDGAGRVVNVHSDAVPGSLQTIRSAAPARAAVEVAGGTAARIGIAAGDRVRHAIFGDRIAPP
jgi:hypothetical protein